VTAVSASEAAPNDVPTDCSVKTATIDRSPAPTVPVVCSAGRTRSRPGISKPGVVVAVSAGAPSQSPRAPNPDQPCLTAQADANALRIPKL
jgi:hypothetical protein